MGLCLEQNKKSERLLPSPVPCMLLNINDGGDVKETEGSRGNSEGGAAEDTAVSSVCFYLGSD